MALRIRLAAVAAVLLFVSPLTASLPGGSGYDLVRNDQDPFLRFLDVGWQSALELTPPPDGATEPFELPFEFPFEGRIYRAAVVGEDGWIGLYPRVPRARSGGAEDSWGGGSLPEPRARIRPFEADLAVVAGSRILLSSDGRGFAVRWVRVRPEEGIGQYTFEAILRPTGEISLQYLEIVAPAGLPAGLMVGTTSRREGPRNLLEQEIQPKNGLRAILFPRDLGYEPKDKPPFCDEDGDTIADPSAPLWCQRANPGPLPWQGRECIPGGFGQLGYCCAHAGDVATCAGQAGGFDLTPVSSPDATHDLDCSDCADSTSPCPPSPDPRDPDFTTASCWTFYEDQASDDCYCKGCNYTFYILVECGSEMHLPFYDVEGMRVRMSDGITGAPLLISAENECAKDPFQYCEACSLSVVAPEAYVEEVYGQTCQDLVTAGFAEFLQCQPLVQTDVSEVAWGAPNPPPCTVDSDTCPGGTGTNPQTELQDVDVFLQNDDGLCGVFRVDLTSGGCKWDLYSNCSGEPRWDPNRPDTTGPQFKIFTDCGAALAAWTPLPELILTGISVVGDCTDPYVEVTMQNLGCETPDVDVPVLLEFTDPLTGDPKCTNASVPFPMDQLCPKSDASCASGGEWTESVRILDHCLAIDLPVNVRAVLDPDVNPGDGGLIVECTEASPAACEVVDIPEIDVDVCLCDYDITPDLVLSADRCGDRVTQTVDLTADATGSFSVLDCPDLDSDTLPDLQYQFWSLDPDTLARVQIEQAWSAQQTLDTNIDCARYAYEVEVRCPHDTEPDACTKSATATGQCFLGAPLEIVGSHNEPDPVCPEWLVNYDALLDGQTLPTGNVTWTLDPSLTLKDDPPGDASCPDPLPTDPQPWDCCYVNGVSANLQCPYGVGCGNLVFAADVINEQGCLVTDDFNTEVLLQPAPQQNDTMRLRRVDLPDPDTDTDPDDLEFVFNPFSSICPAGWEAVAYRCGARDLAACPLPSPTGQPPCPDCMGRDGELAASGTSIPLQAQDLLVTPEDDPLVFYKVRAVAQCVGPGDIANFADPPDACPGDTCP